MPCDATGRHNFTRCPVTHIFNNGQACDCHEMRLYIQVPSLILGWPRDDFPVNNEEWMTENGDYRPTETYTPTTITAGGFVYHTQTNTGSYTFRMVNDAQ